MINDLPKGLMDIIPIYLRKELRLREGKGLSEVTQQTWPEGGSSLGTWEGNLAESHHRRPTGILPGGP